MTARRKTNRRQFLKGRSAAHAISDLSGNSHEADEAKTDTPGAPDIGRSRNDLLLQVGRRAMACQFQIFLKSDGQPGAVEAAIEALDRVDELEAQMTVYRAESEISLINQAASQRATRADRRLFDLLSRCRTLSDSTDGAFDITAGPLAKLWGFHTRQGRFPSHHEVQDRLRCVGSRYLELDPEQHTVRFLRHRMELNLGSVGKGYALDCCAAILETEGIKDFMIHGGHSSILARGSRFKASDVPQWRVALRHPLRPERRLAEIRLCSQGLGTSGSGQQFFYHRGRRYGHVLDPRSGQPAEGVLSATVLAPSAEHADALATAFFVMGVEASRSYCDEHPDLSVIFVLPGTRRGSVAIESINIDDDALLLDL